MRKRVPILAFLMAVLILAGLLVFATVMASTPGPQESGASQMRRVYGTRYVAPEGSLNYSDSPQDDEIAAPGSTH